MTRLHLVRHGPTHAKTMVGWSDLPADLSDTAALRRLHDHLPSEAIVISSDLSRAVDTASAIQGPRLRLPHNPDLREIHFGSWELRGFADIEAEDPELAFAYWDNPGDVRPPKGESWNDVRNRVDTAIDALVAQHTGRDLVIVAHFGVILTQVQRALDLDGQQTFSHRIDNLSVTDITLDANSWTVGKINHLP
ncbi:MULTISPECIES: histidine phosphatase family protein [unclassified Ruegeria]|uniref:histidine phosphatase family protein n=1 Tax=unclassified Ruegeria TaxID=2625375 RepID=UPI001492EF5D|nr:MULTISPECIES: histidine phosphatase family protein [unclassified Ruegeria]NOD89323.1 histidine phosphatase family protein [Ruegeria sp. HKCCD4318]NOE13514.1 histidine phosphatase family protein [Ruegeria sp. HKCCD4318-2]NOG07737.1 histidine phosphatase family protein [Ruegeria sp. HKCCD4315]